MIRNVTWVKNGGHFVMSVAKFACVLSEHYKYVEPFNATFCGVTRSTIAWMKKDSSIFDMMNSQEMRMYREISNV